MNLFQHALASGIRLYRWGLSPLKSLLFGPAAKCRFQPSCSEYALQAVTSHGALRGSWLGVRRLCRCHPWGSFGYDPVPPGRVSASGQRDETTDPKVCYKTAHKRSQLARSINIDATAGRGRPAVASL